MKENGGIFMGRKILFFLFLFFIFSTLGASQKDGWFLVWSDEFEYNGLPDKTKWNFETEGNAWGWGNEEAQFYTENRVENAIVTNGCLNIIALREDYVKGFKFTSARINTKNKGDWLYGRFEMRAKLPDAESIWPAFWMMPTDSYYGSWPASGEIDIMEYFGFIPDTVHFSIHTKKYNHKINTHKTKAFKNHSLHNEFHIYAVEWYPDRLDFYFDNEKIFTYLKESDDPDVWPFNKRFYIILNNAVGGNYCRQVTKRVSEEGYPQRFIIDYVRVYQWNDGKSHRLTVKPQKGGKVAVVPAKDIYEAAEKVTIQAIPEPGFKFDRWGKDIESENAELSFYILKDYEIEAFFVPENEIIKNGGFDRNLSYWYEWTDTSIAKTEPPVIENGELKYKILKAGKYNWQAQIGQRITLEKNKTYLLTFEARANSRRKIRVSFNQDHSPYSSYAEKYFELSTEKKEFIFEMKMSEDTDNASRIEFDFGDQTGTVWLDNVSVIKKD